MNDENLNPQNRQVPWQAMVAALVEGTGAAVIVCDAAGRVIEASPRLCDLLGETQAQILQRSLSDLFVSGDLPGDQPQPTPAAGAPLTRPPRLRGAGRLHEIYLNTSRLPDGCLLGIIDEKGTLQASQAAQACIENAPIAIFRIGANATILEANQRACQSLGYTHQELIGMPVFAIDPTYTPEIWREHRKNLAGLSDRTFESIQKRKDGSIFPVEITVNRYPFQGQDQSYSFVQDISQRRETQHAISEIDLLLRKSQSVGQIGSYYFDIATGFWFSTPVMDELFGIPQDYLKDTNGWLMLVHPEDRPEMQHYLVQHILTEHQRFDKEYRVLRPCDQQVRWMHGRGELEFDEHGRLIKMIGTIQDITARKQVEIALRASEYKFRSLTEQMPDFVWQKDLNSVYTFCNKAFADSVSKSAEAVAGCMDEDLYPPELAAQYRANDQQVISTGQPLLTEEKWQYQGNQRWLQTIKVPLLDENGRCRGTISVGRDITEQKRSLEALQRIEWMLTPSNAVLPSDRQSAPGQAYGDLTLLNTQRTILDAVGTDTLHDIVGDFLDLMGTSSAVYEKNGDYAFGIFSSGWCQFMDLASRNLCEGMDNQQALSSGRWNCHESCWKEASQPCMITGAPTEIECQGGIHLYSVPIQAGNEIVGSINFGHGDPPRDPAKLQELSQTYGVSVDLLRQHAERYETRPKFIIELAKRRLQGAARLIGTMVERKQAEEMAEKSTGQIRGMFETIPDGITFTDLQGNITQVNDAVVRMHDYAYRDELIGKSALILIAPGDHARAIQNAQKTAETGRSGTIEFKFTTQSGVEFDAELNSVMLTDPQGRPTGFVALTRDISERKRMEAALQEANAGLTRAQRIAQLGSWEQYLPTGDLIWSDTMYQIMGFPDGERVSMEQVSRCFSPAELARLQAAVQAAIQDAAPYSMDYQIMRPDGQNRYIHDEGEVIRDDSGKPEWMIGTTQDITERKRNEIFLTTLNTAAIAMQKANNPQQIFTAVSAELAKIDFSCAFFIIDDTKKYMRPVFLSYPNIKKAEKLIGKRLSDVLIPVQSIEMFRELVTTHKAVFLSDLAETTRQVLAKPFARLTGVILKQFGLSISIIAPLIIDNDVNGLFSVQSDSLRESDVPAVTALGHQIAAAWHKAQLFEQAQQEVSARRVAEAQVRQLNEELEKRVTDRTARLQTANADLEAFAYSVSHDLRAPLRAINGYTQILIEDHGSELNEEAQRVCEVISKESQRMGQLIDELLTFSRLGRAEMQLLSVDMHALVKTVFDELTTPQEKENTRFQLDPLPKVAADPILIRQVWVNLLSNALKFSRNRQQAVIRVGSTSSDGETIFWIKDNGAGFDMRYVDKLFGVFQRLHTEKEFRGTGVGLAIVQRVVTRHGGRVWAQSEIGQGAEFFFTLPQKGKI